MTPTRAHHGPHNIGEAMYRFQAKQQMDLVIDAANDNWNTAESGNRPSLM
jgi:hypothetical protein